ncbi:hypothetical protein AVEN_189693-1 [Araneus ventricosus]|uniref:Uncharacterized protein n=1 Tax=Araneus ventricosus TaxID=182803 RepID=A0A4Y2RBK8_ARAVE|nr:hypothetical protein AVEN_189693-1 [Araneus ventricosus]
MPRLPRTGNCLPLLGSMVGGAVGTRIFPFCMGSLRPTDTDTISEYARFLILTVPNGELGNMSPFAGEKALKGIGGSPKSVKKLKSGDLLIETTSAIQTKSFLIAKSILNKSLSVTIHRTLNSCRGVISEPQLLKDTESKILTGLSSQGVIAVRRIHIRRGRDLIPTKHIILTFKSTKLPTNIKAGYLNCKVRCTFRTQSFVLIVSALATQKQLVVGIRHALNVLLWTIIPETAILLNSSVLTANSHTPPIPEIALNGS